MASAMREERQARLPEPGDAAETVEMMSAGRPIDGVEARIVNPSGAPVRLDPGTEVVGSPHGLVTVDAARVRPTARGLLFADEIGARLLQ